MPLGILVEGTGAERYLATNNSDQSYIYGKSFHKLWEREPVPTAASMLRDAVHLATMGRQGSL